MHERSIYVIELKRVMLYEEVVLGVQTNEFLSGQARVSDAAELRKNYAL